MAVCRLIWCCMTFYSSCCNGLLSVVMTAAVCVVLGDTDWWRRRPWRCSVVMTSSLSSLSISTSESRSRRLLETPVVSWALLLLQLLWTPAQRKRASMLYFANVFIFFFMAALFSGPGERRFAKVLHVVDLECHWRSYYLDFFLVILKLQGGPNSDKISHIFRPCQMTQLI